MSFESMANADNALDLGRANTSAAWILTDRGSWTQNPFYDGPPVGHPEDDADCYDDGEKLPAFDPDWMPW